jgi:hypothetical protein
MRKIFPRAGSRVEHRTDSSAATDLFLAMPQENKDLRPRLDLEAEALAALEAARTLPPGTARNEAMKQAGILRNAADLQGIFFAKRGRPAKT